MHKISEELCIKLLNEASDNSTGIARINYHESPDSNMQLMLIAFRPNLIYNYIRDSCEGKIIFTCVIGSMTINTRNAITSKEESSIHLKSSESCILDRREWRKTICGKNGGVFIEVIEGKYKSSNRQTLNIPTHDIIRG